MEEVHAPVMLKEVLHYLSPVTGGLYVDATLGLGGHSEAMLEGSSPAGRLIGFEWDSEAALLASDRLSGFGQRFCLIQASYAELKKELARLGVKEVDGLLVDLGVSSLQFDRGERGFSFRFDAPLDMRMSQSLVVTASDIVNQATEQELADIFYFYGEERQARRVAKFIVERRGSARLRTTLELADLVAEAIPRKFHPEKIHVATKVFQGLRIAVNKELDNLDRLLCDSWDVLKPGGRFCVISFHSLEDRMVKRAFADSNRWQRLTNKAVRAEQAEIKVNPRARSAKIRVAAKRG